MTAVSKILFPAFIAYLKIPYVAGAWENCSKVLFRRVLKNTEMSEVKQWLGLPKERRQLYYYTQDRFSARPRKQLFWHQSEARTAATVWNWSGKTLSPGALLAVLYFSSCHIFFRPFRLFLVPTICPWVSEDEFTTSKFCTFNDFFHFLGLNWSLNDVKHTIVVLQKQLMSTKYFLFTPALP